MRDEAHSEWLQYARRNVFDRDLTKFVNTTLTLALDIYLGTMIIDNDTISFSSGPLLHTYIQSNADDRNVCNRLIIHMTHTQAARSG
jgi:hypothetical protein